jgi:hypothetical protein
MHDKKKKKIEEQQDKIDQWLANAEEYVAKNVNVQGSSFLHLGDWQGKSGHPLWMRNVMIPAWMKHRARNEKTLNAIDTKAKGKSLSKRKRHPAT